MRACSEVLAFRERFIALELEPGAEREVREHLGGCPACRQVFVAAEPSLAVSLVLAAAPVAEDEPFVAEVLSGIRQRRLERRTGRQRRWWMGMAAAAVLAIVGSTATYLRLHGGAAVSPTIVAASPEQVEPALVEVEGDGLRLYQLTATGPDGAEVQVAFVVDPSLEL
ncbi:MAG: anti-sigma factor family protein [Thermoanaerobaculaceae bacterium]